MIEPVTRLFLLAALVLLFAASSSRASGAQPPAITVGETRVCPVAEQAARCVPADLEALDLSPPQTVIARTVSVDPDALPLPRPLMVWMVAIASSEIKWNGVVIGRNGVPGPDRAQERPGRFFATFIVPAHLVRPGENLVTARLSAHRLWLPVRRPVHIFDVGPYETVDLPGLADYLPALLALGALAAAGLYFAAAALSDRRDKSALLLASIAGAAILQLFAETARTFVAYTYPWHLPRVAAVAALAAAIATLIAAYSARRFAPSWSRPVVLATAAAAMASVVLVPWYDLKALGAILAGILALLACAGRGSREGVPGARAALAAGIALLGLMVYQRTLFLDQAWYVALAVMLAILAAEQVLLLRQARREREAEALRAEGLEHRLREADDAGQRRIVALKDGARTHRVAESEILFARAADDYCEVRLDGGRTLLVTATLGRLQELLSERFVRIHKSYVVNGGHVALLTPRPQGGRLVVLSDGTSVPVGRRYAAALADLKGGGEPPGRIE